MLFNTIDFALFLPIVFIFYWFVFQRNLKLQNLFIVIASYFFYGWWDWRFLTLILFSTLIDYTIGLLLTKESNALKRKFLLWTSVTINLGFLGFFKYYNFFLDNLLQAFTFFGQEIQASRLNIILPVGISFYTFQTLSYSIDVYKRKFEPTRDFIAFSAFVCFFPQLVAGPIERASNLLPQFYKNRKFEYQSAVDGLRQILWGMFKKIVIADNCALIVNTVYENPDNYFGSSLLIAAILFSFQIYGDFSGYSDIAIGTSRLFGFNLMQNFAFPYFSRDIAEFWRRWHISLSTWFRDYLYFPLGGSKGTLSKTIRNVLLIFLVSGFWHGANWTFVVWGVINASCFLPFVLFKINRKNIETIENKGFKETVLNGFSIIFTFFIVTIIWIFFRAESMNHAFDILKRIFCNTLFTFPQLNSNNISIKVLIALISFLIIIEWIGRRGKHALENFDLIKAYFRRIFYFVIVYLIIVYGVFTKTEFIYFAF